jgi:predicted nucleic acid-binding protein
VVFVDSNVPMYVAGREHPLRGPAQRFLERAGGGDVEICTSTEVLQEILYRYSALNRRDLAGAVYDLFVQLCPVVLPVTLADTDRARRIVTGAPNDGYEAPPPAT